MNDAQLTSFDRDNDMAAAAMGHRLRQGVLSKTGQPYEVRLLTVADMDLIESLQQRVYDALEPAKKNFIVPKDHAFFESHLDKGHPMLGVFCEGQMIAQSIIRAPSAQDRDIGMTDMKELQDLVPESITILQGVICDPAYRGNGLMQVMVKEWLSWAQDNDRIHALAEIEVRNHHSWSVFMQEGMWLVSMGRDENDGAKLYNAFQDLSKETGKVKYRAMKKLSTTFTEAAGAAGADMSTSLRAISAGTSAPANTPLSSSVTECPRNDLPRQHALMKDGFACGAWDQKRGVMQYAKRPF